MAKFDFNKARAKAEKTISNFGEPGQVIIKGSPSSGYEPNGDPKPPTPDTFIDGIITAPIGASTEEINGTSILKGDKFVYFHSDIAPEIGNQTIIGGQAWRIMGLDVQDSPNAALNVYRNLQLRV